MVLGGMFYQKKNWELELYLITEYLIFDNHIYISKSSILFFIATVINFDTQQGFGAICSNPRTPALPHSQLGSPCF
jgi:hypothetical protein